MLVQRFHQHSWGQFDEQLDQAQKQSEDMQETAGQGATQNPEAMLSRMARPQQQDVVDVSDGLVPLVVTGTRSGLNSPVLETGAQTSPSRQRLAPPTPHVPLGGGTAEIGVHHLTQRTNRI